MILDTSLLFWLAEVGNQPSKEARDRIEAAPMVYVSAIAAFEIDIIYRSGQLMLLLPAAEWLNGKVNRHSLAGHPRGWDVCIAATELLPIRIGLYDRFATAATKMPWLPMATGDPVFSAYGVQIVS